MDKFHVDATLSNLQKMYEEKLHTIEELQKQNQRRDEIFQKLSAQPSLKTELAEISLALADANLQIGALF